MAITDDLKRIYRRQLVRNAGEVGRWRYGREFDLAASPSGVCGCAQLGVRIPRSLRHMLDSVSRRQFLEAVKR